jgi:hypothetical protein
MPAESTLGGRAMSLIDNEFPASDSLGTTNQTQPRRSAPYSVEPGYYDHGQLWLYGNVRLLHGQLAYVATCAGPPIHRPAELEAIEREAEAIVLDSKILVCGIHNPSHQRAAIVPLRWGAPRILVVSGGFKHHLGQHLNDEPFRAARLWRYAFDPLTDLIVSRRAPAKLPTFALHNPTVDRMVAILAMGQWPGLSSPVDPLTPIPRHSS